MFPEGRRPVGQLLPGTLLEDRYRILGPIGEGGVGTVYRAEHLRLGQPVAVKVLKSDFVEHESLRPRFEREARALAALNHPNVVAIRDFGLTEVGPYLVMELLEGETLREVIDRGPMPIEQGLGIVRELLRGLAYAHQEGIVHRDLKPGNVFLHRVARGPVQVKLLDFGFVQLMRRTGTQDDATLSQPDETFGTPAYMSPEQLTGGTTSPQTDVYSLGVILFEVLTGTKPFDGELPVVVRAHLSSPVPSLVDRRVGLAMSPELDELVRTAMSKSPGVRFPDAQAMLARFDALPEPPARILASPLQSVDAPPLILAPPTEPPPTAGSSRRRIVAVVFAFALAGVLGFVAAVGYRQLFSEHREPHVIPILDGGRPAADLVFSADDVGVDGSAAQGETDDAGPAEPVDAGALDAGSRDAGQRDAGVEETPAESADLAARVEAALAAGTPIEDDDLAALRALARQERDDADIHVLFGRALSSRNWSSDAIERYRLAFEMDRRVGRNRAVLEDLIRMAANSRLHVRAAGALDELAGRRAIPLVRRALRSSELSAGERARLERLRDSLRR